MLAPAAGTARGYGKGVGALGSAIVVTMAGGRNEERSVGVRGPGARDIAS
jgi:hypothetical protein